MEQTYSMYFVLLAEFGDGADLFYVFYCVNTSYPMDNCFTGRRDRSRQTPEKDVLYIIPAGPVSSVLSLGGASYLLPV